MTRKRCTKCGRMRLIKFFYLRKNKTTRYSWCKHCLIESNKNWTPTQRQAKHYLLRSRFGISIDEYERMLEHQNGCCGACGRHHSQFVKRLAVDHCHRTGLIRGLLCAYCNNRVIGRHRLEWLQGAVTYLTNPPALRVIGERIVLKKRRRRGQVSLS